MKNILHYVRLHIVVRIIIDTERQSQVFQGIHSIGITMMVNRNKNTNCFIQFRTSLFNVMFEDSGHDKPFQYHFCCHNKLTTLSLYCAVLILYEYMNENIFGGMTTETNLELFFITESNPSMSLILTCHPQTRRAHFITQNDTLMSILNPFISFSVSTLWTDYQ